MLDYGNFGYMKWLGENPMQKKLLLKEILRNVKYPRDVIGPYSS